MNTQQKLADIYMLVTYIKEHIDNESATEESGKLDEIGAATLSIANVLESIEEKTGNVAISMFHDYKDVIDKVSDQVLGQLTGVKDTLDANTNLTKDLYQKIEEIYIEYTGTLESSTKRLELHQENYNKEIAGIREEIASLTQAANDLSKKVMTEDELMSHVKALDTQLANVIERDKEWQESYENDVEGLNVIVGEIQNTYQSLNDTLLSVDSSFKTAVSRMDILLMQMDLLTKEGRA